MDKRVLKRTILESDNARVVQEDMLADEGDSDDGRSAVPLELVYEKRAVTKEKCWGCEHTFKKPSAPGDNPKLDHLWGVYERNVDSMNPRALATLLAGEFRRTYYEPAMELGVPCTPWPEHVIMRHIEGGHVLDRRAEMRKTVRIYSTIESELSNGVFKQKDGEQGFKIDEKRVKALVDVTNVKLKVLSMLKDNS